MITNTEGGITGDNSNVIQFLGSRDDFDVLILTFLPNGLVWALSDSELEDVYRYEEYPKYLSKYSQDAIINDINWANYGCGNDSSSCINKFIQAISSIIEEGTSSDTINEFEDEYPECIVSWSKSLTGLDYITSKLENNESWQYTGYSVICATELEISLDKNKFTIDNEDYEFEKIYDELSDILFNKAWNEESGVFVGVGILKNI